MPAINPEITVYDETPYGDLAYYLTHPGHIAAIATLRGQTPATQNVRVLELGCGSGFNLLAMSRSMPDGKYTGVDLSAVQIEQGRAIASELGASNVDLQCASIDDFDGDTNGFDYIIAHGVYSWVPGRTRDSLMSLISRQLAPDGVAYISYNTNPGWHLRGLVRDALRFFADPASGPQARIARARDGATRLAGTLLDPESMYARSLQSEWARAEQEPDYYLLHEYLGSECEPILFQDFAAHASAHGLQFLAESRYGTNSFAQPEAVLAELDAAAGDDLLHREQYLDWMAGRYFRQSLLCRAASNVSHELNPDAVMEMRVLPTQTDANVDDEACAAVLSHLATRVPAPVPAVDLEEDILSALGMGGMAGMMNPLVAAVLLSGWRDGLWTLRADTPALATSVSERPTACPLARWQARTTGELTNRLHRPVQLDEAERRLLISLDGTHPVSDAQLLKNLAAKGLLSH